LFHNNPVRVAYEESKLIWPDIQDCHPDILLSIGTSHNGQETGGTLDVSPTRRLRRVNRNSDISVIPEHRDRRIGFGSWFRNTSVAQFLNVMVNRMDNILNSEQMWQTFKKDVLSSSKAVNEYLRYIRVNPKLGYAPPRLDDKGKLVALQMRVVDVLRQNKGYKRKISRIAHRLIASTFYFEKTEAPREVDGHHSCQGTSNFIRTSGNY
jgi:hypothetical protein